LVAVMDTDTDLVRYLDIALMAMNRQILDLKALLDARYDTQTKAIEVASAAAERAMDRAEKVLDRRIATINARLDNLESQQWMTSCLVIMRNAIVSIVSAIPRWP
jgi:uncharacterized protein YPO0396